jgi:hypothetical protein
MKNCRGLLLLLAAAGPCAAQLWDDDDPPINLQPSELKQMLTEICPDQVYVGKSSGCHVCPDFSSAAGQEEDTTIEPVIAGHFSDSGSDDMIMVLRGCESHATGFENVLLFTKTSGQWLLNKHLGHGPFGDCRKIRNRQGRDGLICLSHDNHFATAETNLSFRYAGASDGISLVSLMDNGGQTCVYGPDVFVFADLKEVKRVQRQGGGLSLSVTVTCGKTKKVCDKDDPNKVLDSPAGPSGTYRLEYRFDGENLKLAPSSLQAKRRLDACVKF